MLRSFDYLWHKTLRQPYKLHRSIDAGNGPLVVLLHGIGSSGAVWTHVAAKLQPETCHVLALDLLGFGASPKPDWPNYSVDDHAMAVIAAIRAQKPKEPVVIVGHSMGCLVAAHVAKLAPTLVKQLILYEMPLYAGLPETRANKRKLDMYMRIYGRIIASSLPERAASPTLRAIVAKLSGFEIREDTWQPFVKSLENTIIKQTTLDDIKQLALPIDIIYGSLDMLVIRGTSKKLFGHEATHINTQTITEFHAISPRASMVIVGRIEYAMGIAAVNTPAIGKRSKLRPVRKKQLAKELPRKRAKQ